ncbi:hypothetical protein N665_0484s0001 [Sinapis alba]|nr:hypothetical protein N665_0484s0001 [Sinapis alba]
MPTPKTKPKKICGLKPMEVTCNTSRSKSNDKKIVPSKKKPKVQHVQTEAVPKKGTQEKHNQYPKQKVEQCKSSELSKLASIICYRCHQKGHYAVACPSRSVETLHLEPPEINAFKHNLAQPIPEMSISSVIHLSLPRDVDAGNKRNFEEQCLEADIFQTNVVIKARPRPVTALKPELISGNILSDKYKLVDYWSDIFTSYAFKYSVFNDSSSNIIPLLFPLSVKTETGTIEVFKDWREEPPEPKTEQNKGVILSYLLKGEPPDAPRITTPKTYQGKTLNSQRRMKANLLSLGAGDIVSRSKLLQ